MLNKISSTLRNSLLADNFHIKVFVIHDNPSHINNKIMYRKTIDNFNSIDYNVILQEIRQNLFFHQGDLIDNIEFVLYILQNIQTYPNDEDTKSEIITCQSLTGFYLIINNDAYIHLTTNVNNEKQDQYLIISLENKSHNPLRYIHDEQKKRREKLVLRRLNTMKITLKRMNHSHFIIADHVIRTRIQHHVLQQQEKMINILIIVVLFLIVHTILYQKYYY